MGDDGEATIAPHESASNVGAAGTPAGRRRLPTSFVASASPTTQPMRKLGDRLSPGVQPKSRAALKISSGPGEAASCGAKPAAGSAAGGRRAAAKAAKPSRTLEEIAQTMDVLPDVIDDPVMFAQVIGDWAELITRTSDLLKVGVTPEFLGEKFKLQN